MFSVVFRNQNSDRIYLETDCFSIAVRTKQSIVQALFSFQKLEGTFIFSSKALAFTTNSRLFSHLLYKDGNTAGKQTFKRK